MKDKEAREFMLKLENRVCMLESRLVGRLERIEKETIYDRDHASEYVAFGMRQRIGIGTVVEMLLDYFGLKVKETLPRHTLVKKEQDEYV